MGLAQQLDRRAQAVATGVCRQVLGRDFAIPRGIGWIHRGSRAV